MEHSQKQVICGLGITTQTYRYWAKEVPALAARKGKAAKITFGDILALAFTKVICDEFGVRIHSVKEAIQDLFVQLNDMSWIGIESSWLALTPSKCEFITPKRGQVLMPNMNSIFIECAPVVNFARVKFTPDQPNQLRLTFGPKAVKIQR